MNDIIVTVDLDWSCEPAIEETLDFLEKNRIVPTVFSTHNSLIVESVMDRIEVGLHPYFGLNSSHGSTIPEVVKHIMDLPHNLSAFRCHQFASCNLSKQAMFEAGMLISSNVCTDLEVVPPFKDRYGLLEVPIFFEDGGYLWNKHPMPGGEHLQRATLAQGIKVILMHPMHFAVNTPHFDYMCDIKQSVTRKEWRNMTRSALDRLRWKGYGIRDLLIELLQTTSAKSSLGTLIAAS